MPAPSTGKAGITGDFMFDLNQSSNDVFAAADVTSSAVDNIAS